MKTLLCISLLFLMEIGNLQMVSAMTANPILSRGKTVYTSSGNAPYLVDNKFGGTTFSVSNGAWIALKVGAGYSTVFVSWNNPNYTWSDVIAAAHSCKQTPSYPVNYTLQASSNSTNGTDGQWATLVTVTGNTVTTRGHLVDFDGYSWVKMVISAGGGALDELEVFDFSNTGTDSWFFPGTSITANTYKATPPTQNYADLIHATYPTFNPVMIRGGIPCINSGDLVAYLSNYLSMANNVSYWAIEMGTNDAWGGTNGGVATFKNNMQTVITACKNAGIQPVIARMIGTNASAAGWQVHPDYLKAIDDLTTQNNLIAGPDFYTWFTSHTDELNSDGVHPNATGAASIQRLWSQKMAPLYASTAIYPTISISSPLNNSSVCLGTSLSISATATITSGSISKVDFYDGTALLGSDNSSPYSFSWNNPSGGVHTLSATATSAANVTATATSTVTVHIPTTIEPYMQVNRDTWTAQASTAVCEGGSVGIGPHPYTSSTGWTWTGPNGFTSSVREIQLPNITPSQEGIYTATFQDTNNCSSSSDMTVTVHPTPTVTITSQTDNAVITTNLSNIQINAAVQGTGIDNVQFYNGETFLGQDDTSPYSFTWNNVANGSYELIVRAVDSNTCADTATSKVVIHHVVTGLEDQIITKGITCFPNPFTETFTLKAISRFDYTIYAVSGKVMETGNGATALTTGRHFPQGLYVVKVQNGPDTFYLKVAKDN